MARLARKTQKIFAGNASNNGVFGSLQAGVPQLSNDLTTIQSLPAFSEGWNAATVSSESLPPLEEFQALQYLQTNQLAYLFQEGVPEWDSATTYYQGSSVKLTTGSDYAIYRSIDDNNVGENPTDVNSAWELVYSTADGIQSLANLEQTISTSTSKYPSSNAVNSAIAANSAPVGSIVAYSAPTAPEGWLICDGSEISRTTYADLFAVIGTTYGVGDGNTSFNLPNYKPVLNVNAPVIGNGMAMGITNGVQNIGLVSYDTGGYGVRLSGNTSAWGTNVGTSVASGTLIQNGSRWGLTADSSKSGMIADLSKTTVSSINYIIKY